MVNRKKLNLRMSTFLLALMAIATSMQASAYIDPGSGSAIMSAIIGFFVAIAMAVKTYWYKIKSLFSGSKPAADDVPGQDSVDVSQTNSATSAEPEASSAEKGGRAE